MPLNTRFPEDFDNSLLWDENGRSTPEHEAMAYGTMWTGINNIKDVKAAHEFYERYVMFNIASSSTKSSELFLKITDVEKFIGMTTNAETLTVTAFKTKLHKMMKNRAEAIIRDQLEAHRLEQGD